MANIFIPKHLEKAYEKGFSYRDDTNDVHRFYTQEIGYLKITEGNIIACDPFMYNDDLPFTVKFPTGSFPVQLAIAQVNDDERVGFARIKFSDAAPETWELAVCEGQDISKLKKDEFFGYGVDAGTGGFMDTSASEEFTNFMSESEDSYQDLIDTMHENYKDTRDWLLWESNKVNVAVFSAGWGDGVYATYIGYDKAGNICRLVTDFQVIE